jgi:hypothetical protein
VGRRVRGVRQTSDWSHAGLWAKALLYANRATEEDRSSPLYPLWSTLVLEFIARSCLARVHPALLADATTDENVLHACGYPVGGIPRSIPASKVFRRCRTVVNGFTEEDLSLAIHLIERRNTELHSGTSGFAGYGTEIWLSAYFRICRLLLAAQEKSLADLLGAEEAAAAAKMIAASEEKVLGDVKKSIAEAKKLFEALGIAAQENLKKTNALQMHASKGKHVVCPACGCDAIVRGEKVSVKKTQVNDETGTLYRRTLILPTSLECLCCHLSLRGHGALHAADMGGNHEIVEEVDPAEYFGIEQPSEEDMQAYAEQWMRDLAYEADAEHSDDE